MRELWESIVNTYNNYRGTGKLLALFLVSVLIICLLNLSKPKESPEGETDEEITDRIVSPILFVLSPISGISYAFALLRRRIQDHITPHEFIYASAACTFMVLVIILSGRWVFSSDDHYMAENNLHIKQEYISVFNDLLNTESGTVRICSTPEISSYMRMYTPRFDVMYVRPVNGDASAVKGDARAVYDQMSLSTPDEGRVVELLRDNGYDHILYNVNNTYWNLPLEEFGYELIVQSGDYRVYKDTK
jgi:hypothetical protein